MDTKTLYAKIATVPIPIKTWLGSEAAINDIEKMEQQFHLPEGSAGTIAKLLQRLQIKDLGPEYLWGSLALDFKLDKDKARPILDEIKRVVLAPIKENLVSYGIDLSLLEKFEMPIAKTPVAAGPTILQEVKTAVPISAPPLPKPTSFPDKGWSGARMPSPAIPASTASMPKPVGEFGRMAGMNPAVIAEKIGNVGPGLRRGDETERRSDGKMQAPAMLHIATPVPKPIQNAPDFRSPSTQNIMGGMGSAKVQAPPPGRPAVIELGNVNSEKAWAPASARVTKDIGMAGRNSPMNRLTVAPPVAEQGRRVSEIMPMPPKAPSAIPVPMPMKVSPMPVSPVPKPPLPGAPANGRPIVKDFLDGK